MYLKIIIRLNVVKKSGQRVVDDRCGSQIGPNVNKARLVVSFHRRLPVSVACCLSTRSDETTLRRLWHALPEIKWQAKVLRKSVVILPYLNVKPTIAIQIHRYIKKEERKILKKQNNRIYCLALVDLALKIGIIQI